MKRIARFLRSLRPHRPMPASDPRCKSYDFGGWVQLVRNHERQFQISDAHR